MTIICCYRSAKESTQGEQQGEEGVKREQEKQRARESWRDQRMREDPQYHKALRGGRGGIGGWEEYLELKPQTNLLASSVDM